MSSLFFHQQYILADKEIPELEKWSKRPVGNYSLYTDPNLEVSWKSDNGFKVTLLGYCYDYRYPNRLNADIVQSLNISCSVNDLIEQLKFLSGIYVVIWQRPDDIIVIPDMCALREVFIDRSTETVVVGSTPNILRYIRSIRTVENVPYYHSKLFQTRKIWPGNKTSYQNVTRLTPNHYLSLATGAVVRFFPYQELKIRPIDEVVREASSILPGILEAILLRKKQVMVGLTSGWDSRVLLAASKKIGSPFLYFVNVYPGKKNKSDHTIPMKLAHKLNLMFIATQLPLKEEKATVDVSPYVPDVLPINCKKIEQMRGLFPGYMSLAGSLSEIARKEFSSIKKLTGRKLAALGKFTGDDFCISTYEEWLVNNAKNFVAHKYDVLDMFYWEEVAATRVGKSTTETHAYDFSIFPVFNCHHLIQTLLSADEKYRDKHHNILYRLIIERLWRETLTEPINPALKKQVIRTLQWLRLYGIYRRLFTTGIVRWKS
jgi:hypothetical protein